MFFKGGENFKIKVEFQFPTRDEIKSEKNTIKILKVTQNVRKFHPHKIHLTESFSVRWLFTSKKYYFSDICSEKI